MNHSFKHCAFLATVLLLASCHSQYSVVWEDNFSGNKLDEKVWSRTTRAAADWARYQSDNADLLEVRGGNLILTGKVNPNPKQLSELPGGKVTADADTARYLTAGVVSQHKHPFPADGKLEIRARLHGAKGAWPAIWLLPFDGIAYPNGGEIDIMERLNSDSIAYQTVHSYYTLNLHHDDYPVHGEKGRIDPDDYNIYGVEFYPDSLIYSINRKKVLTYPRLKNLTGEEAEYQYPFNRMYYLLIDMQLGGSWVGKIDPNDLPVTMDIDWVRQYKRTK